MSATFRLAPTPSGYLHLGNGVNFVLTAALAQSRGARLLLRIDDLDQARVRPGYVRDIDETIRWLLPDLATGLLAEPIYQSRRVRRYAAVLEGLRQNDLVFACSCSRKQLAAAQKRGGRENVDINVYPGTCAGAKLELDAPNTVWRMRDSGTVVRQRNGRVSYQLASLTDDVDHDVTHLVRGEDLRTSTAMQSVLAKALRPERLPTVPGDWPTFGAFLDVRAWHHPLLLDDDGRKLSKSDGAQSLRAMRAAGAAPAVVLAKAAQLLGAPPVESFDELTSLISAGVPTSW